MDGWALPFAPEQAFTLAMAQERVGVIQFATPGVAMNMNFAPVVIGAKGDKGPAGDLEPFVDVDALVAATLFS